MGSGRRLTVIELVILVLLALIASVHGQIPGVIASSPYLQSLSVSGLPATCINGTTYPATATGHYSQGATRNLTAGSNWSCNANCSVDSSGNVTITGSPSSTATASASFKGRNGSQNCTVGHL